MYDELNSIFRDRVMVQCGLTYFEGTERPLSQTGFKGCLDETFAPAMTRETEDRRATARWRSRKRTIFPEPGAQREEKDMEGKGREGAPC